MYHPAHASPELAELTTLHERVQSTARLAAAPDRRDWSECIASSLDSLRRALRRHFQRDEDERLNEAFLAASPRLEPALRDLLSEHGVLMDRLESLCSRARDVPGRDGAAHRRLGCDVGSFLVELQAHERAERELVQRAASIDLGGGD